MKNLLVAVTVALLAGCSSPPVLELQAKLKELLQLAKGKPDESAPPTKAQPYLAIALKQYEEGEYTEAEKSLQSALYQGLPPEDQVRAHKHLAFIHCAAERKQACREEFRKALAVDPAMTLAPAEAGHPTWGPVFKTLRASQPSG